MVSQIQFSGARSVFRRMDGHLPVMDTRPQALLPAGQFGSVDRVSISPRFAGQSDPISYRQSEALCRAAQNGDFQRLRRTLAAGFDPDFVDSQGNRILHYAAEWGNREAARALIRAGAEVDALDGSCHRRSPLMLAARLGHLSVVDVLLQARANIELADNQYGCRALHHAAIGGQVEVVKRLLAGGAKVNATDRQGATPLKLAERKEYTEVAQLLAQAEVELAEDVQLLAQAEAASDPPFRGFPILPLVFPESVFFMKRTGP